jgi:hypothetical protein
MPRTIGITATSLRARVADGQCFRRHHGWYSVRAPTDERDRHWLRVSALLQEYAGLVVASHGSALVWLGLPTKRVDHGTIRLMWRHEASPFRSFSRTNIHERVDHPQLPLQEETVHPALAIAQVGLADQRSPSSPVTRRCVPARRTTVACAPRAMLSRVSAVSRQPEPQWNGATADTSPRERP